MAQSASDTRIAELERDVAALRQQLYVTRLVDAVMPLCRDERLREKEFGIIDGLTARGMAELMPDQAEFRASLGKFYHRPPGGC